MRRCRYLLDNDRQCPEHAVEKIADLDLCVYHLGMALAAVRRSIGARGLRTLTAAGS